MLLADHAHLVPVLVDLLVAPEHLRVGAVTRTAAGPHFFAVKALGFERFQILGTRDFSGHDPVMLIAHCIPNILGCDLLFIEHVSKEPRPARSAAGHVLQLQAVLPLKVSTLELPRPGLSEGPQEIGVLVSLRGLLHEPVKQDPGSLFPPDGAQCAYQGIGSLIVPGVFPVGILLLPSALHEVEQLVRPLPSAGMPEQLDLHIDPAALPFPGLRNGKVQRRGVAVAQVHQVITRIYLHGFEVTILRLFLLEGSHEFSRILRRHGNDKIAPGIQILLSRDGLQQGIAPDRVEDVVALADLIDLGKKVQSHPLLIRQDMLLCAAFRLVLLVFIILPGTGIVIRQALDRLHAGRADVLRLVVDADHRDAVADLVLFHTELNKDIAVHFPHPGAHNALCDAAFQIFPNPGQDQAVVGRSNDLFKQVEGLCLLPGRKQLLRAQQHQLVILGEAAKVLVQQV